MKYYRSHVLVCVDPECLAKGAHELLDALQDELVYQGLIDEVQVLETSRIGGCAYGPEIMVYPEGVHYANIQVDQVPYLVEEHFLKGRPVEKLMYTPPEEKTPIPVLDEIAFFKGQVLIALRNRGLIDPDRKSVV